MSRRGLLLFAAMCVIWGIPYLFIRVAVSEISPAVLVFGRTGLAALILLPIALTRGAGLRAIGNRWPALVAFAAVEVGAPWFFLSSAEQQITSALAGLLISAVPLVSLVIAILFFRNRQQMGAANVAGLVLGVVGVVFIVGFDLRASNAGALLEMAVVVVGYSLGPAIANRYLSGVPSVTVNGVALTLCCLAYAPVAALQWPHTVPHPAVFGSIVVLAVVCTALAFLLFFELIAEVGPVRATVITYVNPAVAAILGVTVLREPLTWAMGAGFALVIAGSVFATRRRPAPAESRVTGPSPDAARARP